MAPATQGTEAYIAVELGTDHTCALSDDLELFCWGGNAHHQLGYVAAHVPEQCRDGECSTMPSVVLAGFPFASFSAGDRYTCGGTPYATLYCWGEDNWGESGTSFQRDVPYPLPVGGRRQFAQVAAGTDHTCGADPDGVAYCWGRGDVGQLGSVEACGLSDGVAFCTTPQEVIGGLTFASVGAGDRHSCGLTVGGAVHCWGAGDAGVLGNGSRETRAAPAPVSGEATFVALSVGARHACALTDQQEALCWGLNDRGQLGVGDIAGGVSLVPIEVVGGLQFSVISAGARHTCGLTVDRLPYCWGANGWGQLGDGTSEDRFGPVPVTVPG